MSPLAVAPLAATVPLADSDAGKGSPVGLFVVLLLVVATYLLYRSMSGHIRRLPDRFPGYPAAEPDERDELGPPAESSARPDDTAAPDPAARAGNPAGEAGERTGPA